MTEICKERDRSWWPFFRWKVWREKREEKRDTACAWCRTTRVARSEGGGGGEIRRKGRAAFWVWAERRRWWFWRFPTSSFENEAQIAKSANYCPKRGKSRGRRGWRRRRWALLPASQWSRLRRVIIATASTSLTISATRIERITWILTKSANSHTAALLRWWWFMTHFLMTFRIFLSIWGRNLRSFLIALAVLIRYWSRSVLLT